MALTIFLPVRKGSERVIEKNTRNFSDIQGGLLVLKLMQLLKVENVDEIVVSTNDEKAWELASDFKKKSGKLKLVERPEGLGTSQTILSDLIRHVPETTSSEEILWTHVTSPFCDSTKYTEAIATYMKMKSQKFDSLISGCDYREFLFDKGSGHMVNNPTKLSWPRTQDLKDWFEINNAIFLASREHYLMGNRIGDNPYLMECDKITSLDIDNEEDFKIAEAVYERVYR